MCVAIYKPENVQLSKRTLKRCFRANRDGAGFAYLDEKRDAVIRKGFFTFNAFWKDYRNFAEKEAIIHFRWATHGVESIENCHPFAIPDGALIHNGIITWCEPKQHDPRSDTRVFTEDLLSLFLADGYDPKDPEFKATLENVLGSGNKMVLFHKGAPVILNEQHGQWKDGAWFSNLTWQWESVYPYAYSASYIDETDNDYRDLVRRNTDVLRRVCRDFKKKRTFELIEGGPVGFNVSGRTEADEDKAILRYLDKQGLWDEESDDEIAEDEDRCDLCDKMIFQGEMLITLNGQSMCRTCWLNFGDWERDLAKPTDEDAAYNDRLFAKYYRENY